MKIQNLPLLGLAGLLAACGGENFDIANDAKIYDSSRPYLLPLEAGRNANLKQGFSGGTHGSHNEWSLDFTMQNETPIVAVKGGEVTRVVATNTVSCPQTKDCSANVVEVEHDDGTTATYAHLAPYGVCVSKGVRVEQGDIIALSGNTGNSTDHHLHLEINPPSPLPAGTSSEDWKPRFQEVNGGGTGFLSEERGYVSMNMVAVDHCRSGATATVPTVSGGTTASPVTAGGDFIGASGNILLGRPRMEGPLTNYDSGRYYELPYKYGIAGDVLRSEYSANSATGFLIHFALEENPGDDIVAARSGSVIETRSNVESRSTCTGNIACPTNFVTIEHSDGTIARYSNLDPEGVCVSAGETIQQGDIIGELGNTGNQRSEALGLGLQFQVWSDTSYHVISTDRPKFKEVGVRRGFPVPSRAYASSNKVKTNHCN